MGDYAFFVWSAYGVTAVAILGLIARALIDYRAQAQMLARLDAGTSPASRGGVGGLDGDL